MPGAEKPLPFIGRRPSEVMPPERGALIERHMAAALRGESSIVPALPSIRSGTLWEAHRTTPFVRDNGAGFDPADAGKLFRPLSRLHPAADYPGTGIGLASVRRIIERHHGRCWAEGKPGQAAVLHFTLPAPPA